MTLYGTGMWRVELPRLKVSDIDSQRMMVRVDRGKGGRSRDVSISPALLETLREYWRWRKPNNYLFPSRDPRRGPDRLISDKSVSVACREVARRPDLRHRSPFPFSKARAPSIPGDRAWWVRAADVSEVQ